MKRQSIRFGRPLTKKKPLSTEALLLHIESISQEGRGIARHLGKTIFVDDALSQEDVEALITTQHKRYDEAQLVEVIKASPDRTTPLCKHYEECGGCQLQHLEHSAQILVKQANALNQLQRFGEQVPLLVEGPLQSAPWHYRRSARLGLNVLQKSDESIVGFRRRKSNKLLQIISCPVIDQRGESIFTDLKSVLDQLSNSKSYTHAELLFGDESQSLLLRCKGNPKQDDKDKLTEFARSKAFNLYIKTDSEQLTLLELKPNSYTLPDENITLNFQPGDFLQVNADVNKQMIRQAVEWLELSENDTVLDLFCGLGNFTLPIARHVKSVIGVEGSYDMVKRAEQNATLNTIDNASFFRTDLSKDIQPQPWFSIAHDKIILDPPRTGAYELLKQLSSHASHILYISCDPSALARDSKLLLEKGYQLVRFNVMDMFPHTNHVESMALFKKVKNNASEKADVKKTEGKKTAAKTLAFKTKRAKK
ncbi:23S rRNA (uracil(1939)-C(5))-methyltransferase RlmD [Neptunomonas antarctica]|uniref:23S rRNA (uracil(1939)-C(5))-methyltransferase RlmD n=1 Tax=Neptunomonas antarctica TaxID=619304 RepID=A0A1N7JVS1_9GAMM|nr:23S rRNA (uracil(1939)-C(5))-methyltransferase RlmD [Neptunomonas antarctica]SIS53304.1 23S rRNA m(5)U-1939 methyltransferase [Neptunomonas antarctica]